VQVLKKSDTENQDKTSEKIKSSPILGHHLFFSKHPVHPSTSPSPIPHAKLTLPLPNSPMTFLQPSRLLILISSNYQLITNDPEPFCIFDNQTSSSLAPTPPTGADAL